MTDRRSYMSLALESLYPHLSPLDDYVVALDDADTGIPTISEWYADDPMPTWEQIDHEIDRIAIDAVRNNKMREMETEENRAAEAEFERQMLAGYSSVTELVADIATDTSPGRSGGPRQRAKELLAELRRNRGN